MKQPHHGDLGLGRRIMAWCDALAGVSEDDRCLTRTYLSDAHRAANDLVAGWMREAGMEVRVDAVGNLIGRYEGRDPTRSCLMIGSHLDTVRDAGRYDGMLGVLCGIACVEELHRQGRRLPMPIEVVGFGDEEGVRFQATMIGSKAVAGMLPEDLADKKDRAGITVRDAMLGFGLSADDMAAAGRRADEIAAYLEVHIEQGPVLEKNRLPVGIVRAISGVTRLSVIMVGIAGHAGTVPMAHRFDALAGAAEAVLAVERICGAYPGVVGTVGSLIPSPGAVNVIPGQVVFTIDVRCGNDDLRAQAVEEIVAGLRNISERRHLGLTTETLHEMTAVQCDGALSGRFRQAIEAAGVDVLELDSGAGHDAMVIARLAPVAMLFVRCAGGVSHNPAESVSAMDVDHAARILLTVIQSFDSGTSS